MPDFRVQKASLGLPFFSTRAGAKEPRPPPPEQASTSSAPRGSEQDDAQSKGFSHYSVSTLLGISGFRPTPSATTEKPKGQMARSILRMLVGSQKATEGQKVDDAVSEQFTDVHNLIPCGDVLDTLSVNVKHDIYLLIRISIDKIMKCTNPQVYKANQANKKNMAVLFGDMRYFSVKVPKQKSDSRNRIVLELVGFEGPKDFPRLFGKVTMHLYEVIQKQSFTEICAMRIRNMVFCTIEVEFMFCYGCFGYGYSHQLKLPGTDPAQSVAYSMFLRVPPPEDRKDHIRQLFLTPIFRFLSICNGLPYNVIAPQRMDYPAFLSPDVRVAAGNFELENPTEITENYKQLQKALQEPPQERQETKHKITKQVPLEKMKQEYRSLKTWHEKAEYLDQLILKRGPKTAPGQTKIVTSHFVLIQMAVRVYLWGKLIDEMKPEEVQKWATVPPDTGSLTLVDVELSQPVPSQEEAESDTELRKIQDLIESIEPSQPIPALTMTLSASSPESLDGIKNLEVKIVRQQISRESETSLSSSGGITETGDSEGPIFEGRVVDEEPLVTPRKESIPEYPPEQTQFQEAVFSGSKFEPFLRHIGLVPAPFPSKVHEIPDYCNLEDTSSSIDLREQEDQDPPYEMSIAEMHTNPSDTKLPKPGEQLSILRLIESNMEFEDEEQDDKEPKTLKTEFIQKSREVPSVAEVKRVDIPFRTCLEDVLVDRLVKVVALKSLLSKNLENLVSEKLSETEKSQELEGSSLLAKRENCLLKERKLSSGEKTDIKNLKDLVSQNLQAQLIGKLSEQHIIPDMELAGNDQKGSSPRSGDLVKSSTDLPKEITRKPLSQSRVSSKTESMQDSQEGPSGIRKADLSESKIDVSRPALPLKSSSSLLERVTSEADLKTEPSKTSLEIIRVLLPPKPETELTQDKKEPKSSNDVFIEKLLKEEVISLKSCLRERFQGHIKDNFPETGLRTKEDPTVCQTLSLSLNEKHKMALEKDFPERRHVSTKAERAEVYATKEVPVLRGNIQNIVLEALSENDIVSLNSILSEKTQDSLLERLSNIGLITEKELGKIVENLFSVMSKETQPKEVKESDLPEGKQLSSLTQSLQDRFSEEELENLKCLLSRLLNERHRESLSESEVKGLTTVLQKSFEDLPIQNSSETGISKVVEIKDECHSIPLPTVEESILTGASVGVSERRKYRSKEDKISSAGEKRGLRGENTDYLENSIFEVETSSKETQTSDLQFPTKKVKHSSKREGHRYPNYADKPIPDMPNSKRGVESKTKPSEESPKRMFEYTSSSFLSAHDIGIQTETRELSKPPNFLPKPPFPVNPQTFLLLHSDPKEEPKSSNKVHQKPSRKKSDKSSKKDVVSCYQSAGTNPQSRRESGSSSKETLKEKGRKHSESPSPKQSLTENRKESKVSLSTSGTRKESLKQKSERKQSKDISPKKSLSKTFPLSDQQQSPPLTEKSSTTKSTASGSTKGNTENPGEDADVESFKHLEKAIERALHDLGRAPAGSPSQTSYSSRPHTSPSGALTSKESARSFSTNNSAAGNPRNLPSSVSKMLENQEHISKMAPEELAEVLRTLQRILQQNTRSQSNR
ncbi:hypothetical protein lerEdw1_004330 [Lerista edwardsae]|nr:hypothetical protein lerEdw1_004330 [Lerista edwardsae]